MTTPGDTSMATFDEVQTHHERRRRKSPALSFLQASSHPVLCRILSEVVTHYLFEVVSS